ncbi:hypothetical protein JL720_14171 [Aureococcus anophagefferens]|nr:hypothetical protein JL720_14171 [Aureococcus anophagefferens]
MRDPVLLVSSGITYERSSLMEALERRPGVDPQTKRRRAPVVAGNITLKRAIEAWRSRPGRPAEENSPPLTVLQWREAQSDPWTGSRTWRLRLHLRTSGMAFLAKVALSSEVVALVGGNDNLLFALYGGDAAATAAPPGGSADAAPSRRRRQTGRAASGRREGAAASGRREGAAASGRRQGAAASGRRQGGPPRSASAVAKRALVVEKEQQLADSERRLEKQLKQLPSGASTDGSRYPPPSMDDSQKRAFMRLVKFLHPSRATELRDAITRRTSRGPVRDAASWALASVERFRDEPDIKVVRVPKDVDAALVRLRAIHEVRVSDFELETVRDLVLLLEPDAAVEIVQELCEWENIDDADKALDDLISGDSRPRPSSGTSSYLPSAQQPTSRMSWLRSDRELGFDFEFDSDVGRLVVTKVQDGSQATACPLLCAGMVVVAVNGFAVSSLGD